MFFSRQRRAGRLGKRYFYGKTPLLENRPGLASKKKNSIPNIIPDAGKLKKLVFFMLIVGTLSCFTYWLRFSDFFKITDIYIDYAEAQSENEYVKNYFADYIGKNIIFTDYSPAFEKLKYEHPEFKSLSVSKSYPHKIKISFSEYTPAANVNVVINKTTSQKFIVNEIGFAAQKDIENPNLPKVTINSDTGFQIGTIIIDEDRLKYILGADKYFTDQFNIKIIDNEYRIIERELHIKTEKYFKILLDMQKPYEEQFDKLKKALSKMDLMNAPLDYIDLRIYSASGDKIIFKKRK